MFRNPTKYILHTALLLLTTLAATSHGAELRHLNRIDATAHTTYTRVTISFSGPVSCRLLPQEDAILIVAEGVSSPIGNSVALRSGSHIRGIATRRRGDNLHVFISYYKNLQVRPLQLVPSVVTLDVGALQEKVLRTIPSQRERIWEGVEKFIHSFTPPLESSLPFVPTSGAILQTFMDEEERNFFREGEDALYRGRASEAVEIFQRFATADKVAKTMALWRLGESYYLVQEYKKALAAFGSAESLTPHEMPISAATLFSYADTVARCGNFPEGRRRMARLVARMAETEQAPLLLVRLGEMAAREGRPGEAAYLWRSVCERFPDQAAARHAALNLVDQKLLRLDQESLTSQLMIINDIYSQTAERGLKEEALFKEALLLALYGGAQDALATMEDYESKYPQGVFVAIVRGMHEELVLVRYRELAQKGECEMVVALIRQNRGRLSRCLTEPKFLQTASACFVAASLYQEERNLFANLAERDGGGDEPFLYYRMVQDDFAIADDTHAEWACDNFLARFPNHDQAMEIREKRAQLAFEKKNYGMAVKLLAPSLDTGKVWAPINLYYLGKASSLLGDHRRAEKAMSLFVAQPAMPDALVADAWAVRGTAREAVKDFRGAVSYYEHGLQSAKGGERDQLIYKIGSAWRLLGDNAQARTWWKKLCDKDADPVWQLLALSGLTKLTNEEVAVVSK